MNRSLVRCLLLLTCSSLLASHGWAQDPTPVKETARVETNHSSAVIPISREQLFGSVPVATRSDEARKLVETSIEEYENVLLDNSIAHARSAAQKDPHFALAFAVWSFAARRDRPAPEALHRAQQLASHGTQEEQLLVNWMVNVQTGNVLRAISLMNDLVARYPNDKHILYLTSEWLYFQQDYDRSLSMMEKMLQIDPNFPPALNMLGYANIETGSPNPAKAIEYLKRYAETQPNIPNPEDSLGEVLRFAGDDQGSIEHYNAALKITPTFITSQVGLGDTYTLMGKYDEARASYDKAFPMATSSRDLLHAKFQKALVYYWEGKPAEGVKELDALLQEAREKKDSYAQYEIGFGRALLNPDLASELTQLHALATTFEKPVSAMSESERNLSLAAILREEIRIHALNRQSEAAKADVQRLEQLASSSRDLVVQADYDSAKGYLFYAKDDFANAANQLAGDSQSPLVLQALALTQLNLGNPAAAEAVRRHLKYLRAPTVEWYLVTRSASPEAH